MAAVWRNTKRVTVVVTKDRERWKSSTNVIGIDTVLYYLAGNHGEAVLFNN